MKLSKAEEELMQILWERKSAYMKDFIEVYPEPKPAVTTLATLLKRMQNKKFVGYTTHGRSRKYYPLIDKNEYFSKFMAGSIERFFNNSTAQFASFFTREANMSKEELLELRGIIDQKLKNKK